LDRDCAKVIAFLEGHSDEISANNNGLIDQTIKHLNALRGSPEVILSPTEVEPAAAKCDEILKQFKWVQ
jgi:hypothetical protein